MVNPSRRPSFRPWRRHRPAREASEGGVATGELLKSCGAVVELAFCLDAGGSGRLAHPDERGSVSSPSCISVRAPRLETDASRMTHQPPALAVIIRRDLARTLTRAESVRHEAEAEPLETHPRRRAS